ncbi:lipase domain-containing protein [Phthorimaea operculella]|nr:lipase domain-containing protein [Phthorimaea operculella]
MNLINVTPAAIFAGLLAISLARPDPAPDSVFGNYDNFLEKFEPKPHKKDNFFEEVGKDINREIADVKQPFEKVLFDGIDVVCPSVKKIFGVDYSQYKASDEPDLNKMTLLFITPAYTITFNITQAAESIPEAKDFDPDQKLYIFIHGFIADADGDTFETIRKALFSQGKANVIALDGSKFIHWLYLRSTTYVRFMGQKLGEVLASMIQNGVDPAQIHIIGHSLGAHISGFAGKTFTNLTESRVGRITGLDPAGPCYARIDEDLRLKNTDADFVDVVHTDAGVLGLEDSIGDVDYYPNQGAQQPECTWIGCSHGRSWQYFAESVVNPEAFPAVKCDSWSDFKKGTCENDTSISYMGFPSEPGTTGSYYLQTDGEMPFSLGMNGTKYVDTDGVIRNVTQAIFG